MERIAEEKRARLNEVLERGVAMIHVDARREGVDVPAALRADLHLRLNLSYRFQPSDLAVSDWGVRETLSFGSNAFPCAVPWSAIFAVSNQQKVWVFPRDIPEELLGDFARAAEAAREEDRAALRVVTPVDSPAVSAANGKSSSGRDPRPRLRLIKNE
jgi:stringent starvation protein B